MASSLVDYAPQLPGAGPISVASLGNPTVSAFSDQFDMLRQVSELNVLGLWDSTIGLAPTMDPKAADMWSRAVGPLVAAAQGEAVSLTQAYLENVLSTALERRLTASFDRKALLRDLRNGPSVEDVYYRPVKTARTALSVGGTRQQANNEAKKRLGQLVRTDLQLAKTKTSQAVLNAPEVGDGVKWYKRVLRGTRNCGLCMYASTRTYYKADLLPIHPGCDCGVLPMTSDPRRIVADPELLAQLKEAGIVDSPEQVVIYSHGEYGPTLARKVDNHLTSASASKRPDMDPDALGDRARIGGDVDGPVLSGFVADDSDNNGIPTMRPEWAELLGASEEIVEVRSGPSILNVDDPPGPGIAYVTPDNRIFYVEYDEFDYENQRAEAEARLKILLEEERRSLPRNLDGEVWNPPQAVLSIAEDRTHRFPDGRVFQVAADAGRGRVVHYGSSVDRETVWHENGHIVAGAFNVMGHLGEVSKSSPQIQRQYFSVFNQPGSAWEEAMEADAQHLRDLIAAEDEFDTKGFASPSNEVNKWGAQGGLGVTPYGATSVTEDFAESWRLAVTGDIAIHKPSDSPDRDNPFAGWETLTFEEMFPNRYAYFQELAKQGDIELPF